MEDIRKQLLIVVPARGGSKRIPKKNILNICQKPMIIWTLKNLLKFANKEQIIVSTDDDEIANTVKSLGISIPFRRPKSLSGDHVLPNEAVKHALKWYEDNVKKIKYILIVYPTAIFLEKKNLELACNMMEKNCNYSVIFSATEFAHPIQRSFRLDKSNCIKMIFPNHYKTRTQDLEKSYYDAGQFYLCKKEIVNKSIPLFNKNSYFIKLPKTKCIDIDNYEDIKLAEALMEKNVSNKNK